MTGGPKISPKKVMDYFNKNKVFLSSFVTT